MIMAISRHKNIVELYEVFLEGDQLYYVFEYMSDGCLNEWIQQQRKSKRPTTNSQVRGILQQILQGLEHVHQHGLCHRDIKPENILQKGGLWKLADFSLARRVSKRSACATSMDILRGNRSNFPMEVQGQFSPDYMDTCLTSYVSTRWYRAPELLLHCVTYGTPIDIYSTACVVIEMYNHRALFPGRTEVDQLFRVTKLLGTTPDLLVAMKQLPVSLPAQEPGSSSEWKNIVPAASAPAIDLLKHMISIDPLKRWTCTQALQHNFLVSGEELMPQAVVSSASTKTTGHLKRDSQQRAPLPHSEANLSRAPTTTPSSIPAVTCPANRRETPRHVSPQPLVVNNPYKKRQRTAL